MILPERPIAANPGYLWDTQNQGPRIKDQGPRIKDQGPRTKDQGPRTRDQVSRSKDQGSRIMDLVLARMSILEEIRARYPDCPNLQSKACPNVPAGWPKIPSPKTLFFWSTGSGFFGSLVLEFSVSGVQGSGLSFWDFGVAFWTPKSAPAPPSGSVTGFVFSI